MPNYNAMTTAFYNQRNARMAQGDMRRANEMKAMSTKLASDAAMGDPQALQQLMQINPQLGMQIRSSIDARKQKQLAIHATQMKGVRDAVHKSLQYAAQFNTPEEAIQGLSMNTDFMSLPKEMQQQVVANINPDTLAGLRTGFKVPESKPEIHFEDGRGWERQADGTFKQVFDAGVDKSRKSDKQFKLEQDAFKQAGRLDSFTEANDFLGKIAKQYPDIYPTGLRFDSPDSFLQYKKTLPGSKGKRLVVDNGVVTYEEGNNLDPTIAQKSLLQRANMNAEISLSQLDRVQGLMGDMGLLKNKSFGLVGNWADKYGGGLRQIPLLGPLTNSVVTGLLGNRVRDDDIPKIKALRSEIRIATRLLIDQIRPMSTRSTLSKEDAASAARIVSALQVTDTIDDWLTIEPQVRDLVTRRLELGQEKLGQQNATVVNRLINDYGYTLEQATIGAKGIEQGVPAPWDEKK